MDKFLTTADVPPQFLADTFLLGHIPYKALTSDPRISYSLYIPPTHYNPDPSKPSNKKPKIPFLIFIHGTRRDIFPIYTSLKTFAEETPCAVLAPLFPMGIEGPNDLDSYKVLRSGSGTLRADEALLDMIQEVGERWVGVETEKVFLMGFSGGGQFVHRYVRYHREDDYWFTRDIDSYIFTPSAWQRLALVRQAVQLISTLTKRGQRASQMYHRSSKAVPSTSH